MSNVGASQPDVSNAGASQFGLSNSDEHLKREAQTVNAKGDLRWAMHLARRRAAGKTKFTYSQMKLLADLDSGHLRTAANHAVKAFGHGRVKKIDGSFIDIGTNCGGMTRTVLDDWVPLVVPSSDEESAE